MKSGITVLPHQETTPVNKEQGKALQDAWSEALEMYDLEGAE